MKGYSSRCGCLGLRRDGDIREIPMKLRHVLFESGVHHLITFACGVGRFYKLSFLEVEILKSCLYFNKTISRKGLAERNVEGPLGLDSCLWVTGFRPITEPDETGMLSLGTGIFRNCWQVSKSFVYGEGRSLKSTSPELIGSGLSCLLATCALSFSSCLAPLYKMVGWTYRISPSLFALSFS